MQPTMSWLVLLLVVFAQQSNTPQTGSIQPSLWAVRAIAQTASADSRVTRRPVDAESVAAEQAKQARLCLLGFDATAAAVGDLPALAELYLFAGQLEQARRTFDRYLREARLSPRERGDAMYTCLLAALVYVKTQTAEAFAEAMLLDLDALTDEGVVESAAMGHYQAALHFRETRLDEPRIDQHASRFLALFGKLSPPQRAKLLPIALNVHLNYAYVLASRGDTGKAIDLLSQARSIGGSVQGADEFLKAQTASIALVGQPAPAVQGDIWFNTTRAAGTLQLKGRVRLVVFTAHWCSACVATYELFNRLTDAYGKKGLEAILVTRVWRFFPDAPRDPSVAQEVEFDRRYYLTQHNVRSPVAIETSHYDRGESPNERAYGVIGYPLLVLVGADGIVQRIWRGWDPRNEPVLRQLIERLRREGPAVPPWSRRRATQFPATSQDEAEDLDSVGPRLRFGCQNLNARLVAAWFD